MRLKFLYIANARIPTEKAHGLQIVKMCEAFAQQGRDVELIVPFRRQSAGMRRVESIEEYYDVNTPFSVTHLPSPDFIPLDSVLPPRLILLLYIIQSLIFALLATLKTRRAEGVYYTRDWYVLLVLALTKRLHGKRMFFEAHEMHGASHHRLLRRLLRHTDGLIVITQALQTYYEQFGVAAEHILVAADGIDARRLTQHISKAVAREQLGIPLDTTLICYTGHLFRWKGVYTLVEAMRDLPADYALYIVGGMEPDRLALQQYIHEKRLPGITLVGHVPYQAVPSYLAAADFLALPNSAASGISRDCTSPLKLFEYMAAQRPIVASDLPSLREVLQHERNACLVAPDDAQAFAAGIQRVSNNQAFYTRLVATAYADVQDYTWTERARHILNFQQSANHAAETL